MVGLGVVCALVAVAAGLGAGATGALALGAAAVAAALTVRLPPRWWPSLLLLVTIAAPAGALPVPGFQGQNGSVSPTLMLVPLWLLAELRAGRLQYAWRDAGAGLRAVQVLGALLVVVMVVETILSPDLLTSGGWVVNLAVLTVLVPLLLRGDAAALLARTWVVAGGVLGVYAVLEAFVLQANPLWGWAGGDGVRAAVSFGNPLAAASFFAGATVLAVAGWLRRPTVPGAAVLVSSAAGLAVTGSRGALIAAAIGVLVVVVTALGRRSGGERSHRSPVALAVVVLLMGAVTVAGLAQRSAAGAEEGSNVVRVRSLDTGLFIAERTGPLGEGPGRAYTVKTETPGPGTDEGRSVENAWLELYIGVGPVGCGAFAGFVVAALLVGVRRRRWDGVAVTITLLVNYVFYNALEGSKPLTMLLLGSSLGLCLLGRPDRTSLLIVGPSRLARHH